MKKRIMIKRLVSMILLLFLCITSMSASALVDGEHSFWKSYITECIGEPSSFCLTHQEAQELSYFGCEYIRFKFGSYQNGQIMMVGMDASEITCDYWEDLDDNKLSNTILKFANNWSDDSGFVKYADDVAVLIEFADGYSLVYLKGLHDGGWSLSDKNDETVQTGIIGGDLFDIILQHTVK